MTPDVPVRESSSKPSKGPGDPRDGLAGVFKLYLCCPPPIPPPAALSKLICANCAGRLSQSCVRSSSPQLLPFFLRTRVAPGRNNWLTAAGLGLWMRPLLNEVARWQSPQEEDPAVDFFAPPPQGPPSASVPLRLPANSRLKRRGLRGGLGRQGGTTYRTKMTGTLR